jgi:LysR family transcriptional regulator, glycine cleavage system transcriptional activator
MSYSLPSLTALRVFEVAGRHQSFSNAAIELNVTQGAVSRQVRALEDELRIKLFVRLPRRVVLTEAGRRYLTEVQGALAQIEHSTAALRTGSARKKLLVSVLPSVGSYWLMPRLARFTERHPDIETRIISSIAPVDLQSHEADVAIRVGALPGKKYPRCAARIDLTMVADWRGVRADQLAPDILVPVLKATLEKPVDSFKEARDVLDSPLIHTSSRPHAWPDWLSAFKLTTHRNSRIHEYGHFFMAIEAAREGKGIALIPDILLTDSTLRDIVPLEQFKLPSAGEYYLLSLAERGKEREICLFREWMQEQVTTAPN